MKNLLHPEVKTEVLARIDKLTPQTTAKWGKMNVNQNLFHMTKGLDIPSGKLIPTLAKKSPLPKWLMKFILLNMAPPKQAVETFLEMNIVENKINPTNFEEERQRLKNAITDFGKEEKFIPTNVMAGKFSRDDWGKLNYNHTDHHLRQFGV